MKITLRLLLCVVPFGMLWAQVAPQEARDLSLDSLLVMKISTASKDWETASEAPASVTIIPSEDIQRFGFRTLADVLSSVRSFYVSYDRNYTYLGVRGFSRPTDYNDRTLLLLNGHTINEGFYGTSPFGTDFALDLNSVDRIEIVRGPGSALYGSGALFAVVNVITKSGGSFNRMSVAAEGGSFGTVRGSLLAGGELGGGVDALLSARWSRTAGQDQYYSEFSDGSPGSGVARGLDWDRSYGLFSSLGFGGWTVQGLMSWREKGIPTAAFGMAFNAPGAQTLDRYGFLDASYQANLSPGQHVMARAYYDDYYYAGVYPYDVVQEDENTVHRLGTECQFRWDLSAANRVIAGLEFSDITRADYHSWDPATLYFNQNFPYTVFSLYLEDEYQLSGSVSLTLGLRRDAYSRIGNSLTPRCGIVVHPAEGTTFKLLYGLAFRSPSLYETEYQDDPSGFRTNRGLSPEKIQTAEAVIEQRVSDRFLVTFSFYHNKIDGLIDQVFDPVDSTTQFRNLSSARAVGGEIEITARLRAGLTGYASYSHQVTTDAGTDIALTNSPTDLLKAGISYAPEDFLQAAIDADYESGRKTVLGTVTDPFLLANLHLAFRFPGSREMSDPGWLERLQFSVSVRNLFNTSYATPGGFEHVQSAIVQDGRNYLFSLAFTL